MKREPVVARLDEILRCPLTQGSLRRITEAELAVLNMRAACGELRHADGTRCPRGIDDAFVSAGDEYAYMLQDGIAVMLESLAIPLSVAHANSDTGTHGSLTVEKLNVQQFYNEVGWRRSEGDAFIDALKYEDLRPVASEYVRKCRLRVNDYMKQGGRYLLDVASGPIQFPEYLTYSEKFDYRICVDLSLAALREARKKLGSHGIYVLGDITNLPLKDNSVDAALSVHTIYHVPKDEQFTAFRELNRVLKSGSQAVVIYSWGTQSPLMNLLLAPLVVLRAVRAVTQKIRQALGLQSAQRLYAYMYSYRKFKAEQWGFEVELAGWRSLSHHCSMVYAHRWLGGRQLLRLAFWFEKSFPRLAGRIGQYPLFIIKKRNREP